MLLFSNLRKQTYIRKFAIVLAEFIDQIRTKRFLSKVEKDPLLREIVMHTHDYFSESGVKNKHPVLREQMINEMLGFIQELAVVEGRVLKLRELIAFHVMEFSRWKILCLTELEKQHDFYINCRAISGELRHSISQAAQHIPELKEFQWRKHRADDDLLIEYCAAQAWRAHFFVIALNILRMEYKDFVKDRDWFNPFIKSSFMYQENIMRQKVGLPSLFAYELQGLAHGNFANFVLQGVQNPYFEWDSVWAKHLENA
jgi:hypothetical protein